MAEHFQTHEEIAAKIEVFIVEGYGDASFIAETLGGNARPQGVSLVAKDSGLSRESPHKALSGECSPGFEPILEVISVLCLRLSMCVIGEADVS